MYGISREPDFVIKSRFLLWKLILTFCELVVCLFIYVRERFAHIHLYI